MNSKQQASLCYCLLLAVLLLGAVPGSSASNCGVTTPYIPFCKDWICKVECWGEAKLYKTKLTESKCKRGGIKGWCYCKFC